jgi:hypothetical protein
MKSTKQIPIEVYFVTKEETRTSAFLSLGEVALCLWITQYLHGAWK